MATDSTHIMITGSLDGIEPAALDADFWEHWPSRPSPERHLDLLRGSRAVALAVAADGTVVGFANAVGDGVLSAYLASGSTSRRPGRTVHMT